MSLLLEALKKAERAKEEARKRAAEGAGDAAGGEGIGGRPAFTRNELPDIAQELEIVSDDLDRPQPGREAGAEPAPSGAPPRAARSERPPAESAEAGRATARRVFEAKFKEPNPRLPFFISLGVLGIFALGTVVYFWLQLRPPSALVVSVPPPQPERSAAAIEPKTVLDAGGVASSDPLKIPGLPEAAPAAGPVPVQARVPAAPAAKPQAPVAAAAQAPKPASAAPRATRAPARAQPAARQAAASRTAAGAKPASELTMSRTGPGVHPQVESGYAAYLAGDLARARADYQQALREEPSNRDALLGIAAVEVRSGGYPAAEAIYVRLLRADPRDAHAQAALIALRSGRGDTLAAESRVKSLLAIEPGAHVLHFALGNQLAQQGRWAEAQQEYFKAFAAEPDNADFAYNLAVSLDHLRRQALALEYYQRALSLARARAGSFDMALAEQRVAQLER